MTALTDEYILNLHLGYDLTILLRIIAYTPTYRPPNLNIPRENTSIHYNLQNLQVSRPTNPPLTTMSSDAKPKPFGPETAVLRNDAQCPTHTRSP